MKLFQKLLKLIVAKGNLKVSLVNFVRNFYVHLYYSVKIKIYLLSFCFQHSNVIFNNTAVSRSNDLDQERRNKDRYVYVAMLRLFGVIMFAWISMAMSSICLVTDIKLEGLSVSCSAYWEKKTVKLTFHFCFYFRVYKL